MNKNLIPAAIIGIVICQTAQAQTPQQNVNQAQVPQFAHPSYDSAEMDIVRAQRDANASAALDAQVRAMLAQKQLENANRELQALRAQQEAKPQAEKPQAPAAPDNQ